MTPEKYRKIQSVVKALNKLAERAGDLELTLGNGGDVGSMLGAIATDVENTLPKKLYADDDDMVIVAALEKEETK